MDNKDEQILQVLEKNAKLSSRSIAQKIGLPISTVHRRIRKLEQEKIIKGYRANIEYEKTNRPIGAYLFVNISETTPNTDRVPKSKIVDSLLKNTEVHELADVQGANFDLILKCRFETLKALSSFIEKLRGQRGVEELFSSIITDEIV
ncbi:MAG: Lrp/AsnC family transcriptional regulator [Candidatus Bathyarchaeota archaeon]|nr:MAG: Lrp/AsnC family transcriptional regulator [Candidatus Bathyarchaeota archaeon]